MQINTAVLLIDPRIVETNTPHPILLLSADSNKYVTEVRKGRYSLTGWQKLYEDTISAHLMSSDSLVRKTLLAKNDYVLQPSRYSAREDSGLKNLLGNRPTVPLANVVDIRSPLPVKPSKSENAVEYAEVRISDFETDGTIQNGSKIVTISNEEVNRIDRQILNRGDILIGTKGTIGKAAVLSSTAPHNLIAGQTTAILKVRTSGKDLRPAINSVVLLRWLSMPEVRSYLESLSGGTTISFLRKKDLADLPVPILNEQEQQKVLDIHEKILVALSESEKQRTRAQVLANGSFSGLERSE